jgi:hypothetical protein
MGTIYKMKGVQSLKIRVQNMQHENSSYTYFFEYWGIYIICIIHASYSSAIEMLGSMEPVSRK